MCHTADDIIQSLNLQPHPEGGFYRETWESDAIVDGRAMATSIIFLLPQGVTSRWHRVDAQEMWIHQAGAPLHLRIAHDTGIQTHVLDATSTPQVIVPTNAWQDARSSGDWTLVACIVSPGFQFEGFEMAPEGWSPDSSG